MTNERSPQLRRSRATVGTVGSLFVALLVLIGALIAAGMLYRAVSSKREPELIDLPPCTVGQ